MNNIPILSALSEIASRYRCIYCDVWGVVHNGLSAFQEAVRALESFREAGGYVVLLTNAPRPHPPVIEQMLQLGVSKDSYDCVVTSGDATRQAIYEHKHLPILHLGPSRDMALFNDITVNLTQAEEAKVIVCTGLMDEMTEHPDDYKNMFKLMIERNVPFFCANPDKVVKRGNKLLWCAGALADIYEQMGGKVQLAGKPYSPIYKVAQEKIYERSQQRFDDREILVIGDGLPTDILGAKNQNLDSLLITNGIHAEMFGGENTPDAKKITLALHKQNLSAIAAMTHLA